jgi:hypothetical protein
MALLTGLALACGSDGSSPEDAGVPDDGRPPDRAAFDAAQESSTPDAVVDSRPRYDVAPGDMVADIEMAITSVPDRVLRDEAFMLGFRLANHGPDAAGIELRLDVAGQARKLRGCGTQPPAIRCNRGIFEPGETSDVDMTFDSQTVGEIIFTLSYATNAELDPNPDNDTDMATVVVE